MLVRRLICTHFCQFWLRCKGSKSTLKVSKNDNEVDFIYRISANSFRGNYSFLKVGVRQLFKGGNYSRAETINFLAQRIHPKYPLKLKLKVTDQAKKLE